jgi:hypothetical protein
MRNQYDKQHAITVIAAAVLAAYRFIARDGTYATAAGGAKDSLGISEMPAAAIGEAIPVVTSYSYLVECSEPIALHDYVRPAADGTGRAAVGTATLHCARAMGATTAAGQLVEVQIVTQRNT